MNKPLLSPINDYVFKKIFGEDKEILTDFLQSILDLPVEEYVDWQVVNPVILPDVF